MQAGVDQPREADVVVAGEDADEKDGDGERDGSDTSPALSPESNDSDSVSCSRRTGFGQPNPSSA
jgi:hypothetical protein